MAVTNIYDALLRDEGFRSSAFQDSLGFWTIGSGICIDQRKSCGITAEENRYLLTNRLTPIQAQISEQFPWTDVLDPVRLAVLWNMGYNLGFNGLAQFRNFLGALQQGLYSDAAQELLNSEWATQVGARAQRLALQISSGSW